MSTHACAHPCIGGQQGLRGGAGEIERDSSTHKVPRFFFTDLKWNLKLGNSHKQIAIFVCLFPGRPRYYLGSVYVLHVGSSIHPGGC